MKRIRKVLLVFLLAAAALSFVFAGCAPEEEAAVTHKCESPCPVCGKCTDKECEEEACADKCAGHSQFIISKDDGTEGEICYHSCSVCGNCTDPYAGDAACAKKCECDGAVRLYRQEAENVTCNGNPAQGGKGLALVGDASNKDYSGGYQIEGTDLVKTEDGIYFKWSITVENDCKATVNIGGAGLSGTLENKNKFLMKVGTEKVDIDTYGAWSGFDRRLSKLADFDLKAGENIIRLYLLGDGFILNIDYFDFLINEPAVFNECAFDNGKVYDNSYETEAEEAVTNGKFTLNEGMLEGLESVKTEDGIFFKWSVSVQTDCEATLALSGAGAEAINFADKFYVNLNGKSVSVNTEGNWTEGQIEIYDLVTLQLKQGENTLFLFVLENEQQLKLDKFVFGCNEKLTFNPVTAEGDVPAIKVIKEYTVEAEETETNGFFDGGLVINGGKVENFSAIKTEQQVYFKWIMTAGEDCTVGLSFYANAITSINFGERFILKVNGEDIVPDKVGDFQTWVMDTKKVVDFNLKAGEETEVYLYVLTDTAGDRYINIDKFIFKTDTSLIFGKNEPGGEHECESVCEVCGKCTNAECAEEACKDKCEGHEINTYTVEAEETVTNGLNGGGLVVNDGKVEGFSGVKTEDGIYFKWVLTASADCKVFLSVYANGIASINFGERFLLKVNGVDVVPLGKGDFHDFAMMTAKVVDFNLKADEETEVYLYVLTDTAGDRYINIDKFIFKAADAELTLGTAEPDPLPHKCESVCEICGKCTNAECTEEVCQDKCEGHEIHTYTVEAEETVTNGLNGGGLVVSGGKIEGFSGVKTEDGIYFKWLVTASADCKVSLSVYANAITAINFSERFLLKVNGTDVVPDGVGDFQTWVMDTKKVVDFDLKADEETTVYLYVLTDTAGDRYLNVDQFIFKTAGAELTFGAAELDPLPHKCESVCEICGKCTNAECTEEVCQDKCGGHEIKTYTVEAEETVTNGLNGGGLVVSGGKIEGFSGVKTEDGIYFKWIITANADCKVSLSLYANGIASINFGERFLLKVNGTDIVPTATGDFHDFAMMTAKVVDFNLKADEETTVYLYVLTDTAGDRYLNVDQFIFKTAGAELTFGAAELDPVVHKCRSVCEKCGKCTNAECTEEACKDKCEGHNTHTYNLEAEETVSNGFFDGGLLVSGGKVENFSAISTEQGVYFKWSITADADCKVCLSLYANGITSINFGERFLLKVNGTDVVPTATGDFHDWAMMTAEVVEFDLKAGEETAVYLYVLTDTAGNHYLNIDKFVFTSTGAELTFNQTEADAANADEGNE